MARGRADHSVWRELIAARLDRPLARSETRALAAHLRECAACRGADNAYREQRALLQALPQKPAPRDLWPRTSAALDRELARGSYRHVRLTRVLARRAAAPSTAVATSLAALAVIAVVGATQLLPALSAPPPAAGPGQATPFAVLPQDLAWVGSESTDLYVYQTHVGHVCPPTAESCSVDDSISRTQVNLPSSVHARNIALSPSGKALALVGRDLNQDLIAVVMLPPNGGQTVAPDPSQAIDASFTPDAGDSTNPSDAPGATPADQPTDLLATPPASAVAGLQVLAILQNVESAGAPPDWSPSGAMLAFSAMPADGSHGPDVYVWSPSDAVAQPITSDHDSYFASWSGEHIVLSRVAASSDGTGPLLSTSVIDPATGEERPVAGPALWLPVVNPARSQAVAWQGDMELSGGIAMPQSGSLVLIDWSAIDPWAPDNQPAVTTQPSPDSSALTTAPTDTPTDTLAASAPPSAPASAAASPSDSAADQPSDAPGTPAATVEPTALPDGWTALDLGGDANNPPIIDWQAHWSLDGQVLGVWVADDAGTTWGRLTVLAIDPTTGQIAAGDPLLKPTLARRGFSLGLSRVAWVAPSDDNPDGELRVRTWGDDGVGGLRLLPAKLDGVVPAF